MAKGLTGVILAGGSRRRMGCDKTFLEADGRPLIEVVADKLSESPLHQQAGRPWFRWMSIRIG